MQYLWLRHVNNEETLMSISMRYYFTKLAERSNIPSFNILNIYHNIQNFSLYYYFSIYILGTFRYSKITSIFLILF